MKYKVKGVAINRVTRKQIGNVRQEIIDTETNQLFLGCSSPLDVEKAYESFWNDLNPWSPEVVKVLSVEHVISKKRK